MMEIFADFHIHVGRSLGHPVKMAAAPSLTLRHLLDYSKDVKGLDAITVIDGVTTYVLEELTSMLASGRLRPVAGGGLIYDDKLLVIPGAEIEVGGPDGGAAHFGCWFPNLESGHKFHEWLATVQKNVSLSSQKIRVSANELGRRVRDCQGLLTVHHAFTPHKGLYGRCVTHIDDMIAREYVDAVELGLSADSDMADCVSELTDVTFLSNSDAHSSPKIAREYNALEVEELSFQSVKEALHRERGQGVSANYGLWPALGKYHRTGCRVCGTLVESGSVVCPEGHKAIVQGVYDRWLAVRDRLEPVPPSHRPPYIHQVPLEYIPGLGPKLRERLWKELGTEMKILHDTPILDIERIVGAKLANRIDLARRGELAFHSGSAGSYGTVVIDA